MTRDSFFYKNNKKGLNKTMFNSAPSLVERYPKIGVCLNDMKSSVKWFEKPKILKVGVIW